MGIVRGLAWTEAGGDTLQIEINSMPGKGNLLLTGKLGDVMKESAQIALSYVRSAVNTKQVASEYFEQHDFHLHVPEGAVPKDGPSAGVAITTALISALTGRAVKRDIAMTGEVTIKGRVLAIGGLKEKSMAAYRAGVKTVFIPKANEPDLEELDKAVTENVRFVTVSSVEDIIESALCEKKTQERLPEVIPSAVKNYETGRISQ